MTVMIRVDPHKGSHTAVAVDHGEQSLSELRVRSGPKQLERLVARAERFPERTWAIENATGLGYLLAQQLVATGERVLDVNTRTSRVLRPIADQQIPPSDLAHMVRHAAVDRLQVLLRGSAPRPGMLNVLRA